MLADTDCDSEEEQDGPHVLLRRVLGAVVVGVVGPVLLGVREGVVVPLALSLVGEDVQGAGQLPELVDGALGLVLVRVATVWGRGREKDGRGQGLAA